MEQIINEYENYLLCVKRIGYNTFDSYFRDVKQFIFTQGINSISDITKKSVLSFRIYLCNQKVTARTISRKISSLNCFFKFLYWKYDFEPIAITQPQLECKLPQYFNKVEIMSIYDYLKQNRTYIGLRNKLLFELLYATGIRVSELVNIKMSDIRDGFILINGKGNKERLVPLPTNLLNKSLMKYLRGPRESWLERYKSKSDYLFFSTKRIVRKFTRNGVWSIFNKIAKDLNIELYPHKLRHSLATHFYQDGLQLPVLKKLLGHESVNSTVIYTHLNTKYLRKEYDKHHPRK